MLKNERKKIKELFFMVKEIFTKRDIENFGFTYEPDSSKCQTRKLRLYVPSKIDYFFKQEIAKQIPYKYVHKVWETPNSHEGDLNFLADSKILVTGHGQIDII